MSSKGIGALIDFILILLVIGVVSYFVWQSFGATVLLVIAIVIVFYLLLNRLKIV